MKTRTVQVAVAFVTCVLLQADLGAVARKRPAPPARRTPPAPSLRCGDLVGFQVLLDRQGFSPGQIDGKTGANLSHALAAMQTAKKLQPSGQPDCDTWKVLGADSAEPTVTSYTLTDEDVKGPFDKIPPKLADQAKLDALECYRDELRPWPHPRNLEAIQAYHRWLGAVAGCAYAEAYLLIWGRT